MSEEGGEEGQTGRSALGIPCIPTVFDRLLFLFLVLLDEMKTILQ